MRVLQTDFFGDANVGLFAKSSDKLCITGNNVSGNKKNAIKKTLGTEVVNVTVANSELVGIFCAMNSNGIILPKISTDYEVKTFKVLAEDNGMSAGILNSKFTAIGNLIICNDRGAAVSRHLSGKDKKAIQDFLDVEIEYATVAGLNSVGSCGIATNRGCILHRDSTEEELDKIQEILRVDTDIGTANFGSPFVGSCGFANGNGVVAGESTTGPEITRIMEALALL